MPANTHQSRPGGPQRIDYKKAEQLLRSGKLQREVAEIMGVGQSAIAEAIDRGMINYVNPRTASGRAMPWSPIKPEHRQKYLARMLRAAHRRGQGMTSAPPIERMLDTFLESAEREGFVVHYDPDTEEGFFRVARREGIDKGLVREPDVDSIGRKKRPAKKAAKK